MPIALITIGLVMIIAAGRDQSAALVKLVQGDFQTNAAGTPGFLQWILAFVLVGALGFVPKLKPLSVAFMALLLVAIFLTKGVGFFDKLTAAFNGKQAASATGSTATAASGILSSADAALTSAFG
jgi:hypothetical protein